jgi:flavodoxin I
MKVVIVYDSRTGNTESAASRIADTFRSRGDEVSLQKVSEASPGEAAKADVLCVGSWTQGLFVVGQHPTPATMRFIEQLPAIPGKRTGVFCSYGLMPGKTLAKMARVLELKGARVEWRVAFHGRDPGEGLDAFAKPVRVA